jgi:hypothetical protein
MSRVEVSHADDYRRPENAPEMQQDCPICFEPLFDENGIAAKDVAKIMCFHLVHSDCLAQAGRALNADGTRYGIGGFGARAGCPICARPVSMWLSSKKAASFPIFWMHRIQACLEAIGPDSGPISIERIKDQLRSDPSLTKPQKRYLDKNDKSDGFLEALDKGAWVWTDTVVNGGPRNGGSIISRMAQGIWDMDEDQKTLWLQKWGSAPRPVTAFAWTNTVLILSLLCVILAVLWRGHFSGLNFPLLTRW